MNMFGRLNNNRSVRSSPPVSANASDNYPVPVDQLPPPDPDDSVIFRRVSSFGVSSKLASKEFTYPEDWATPGTPPPRIAPNEAPRDTLHSQDEIGDSTRHSQSRPRSKLDVVSNQMKRNKTPLSSLYNVSTDEEDVEGDEAELSDNEDMGKPVDDEPSIGESADEFQRRSVRIRRSLNKAKAALPANFVDRIEVPKVMTESLMRDRSSARPSKETSEDVAQFHASSSNEDEGMTQQRNGDEAMVIPSRTESHRSDSSASAMDKENALENSETSLSTTPKQDDFEEQMFCSGVVWDKGEPKPLEEIIPNFRDKPAGYIYLMKAISQRSTCRCSLCGHECLLVFPVLDATLSVASWNCWSPVVKHHIRLQQSHSSSSQYQSTTTESLSRLVVFRQCRGWYEVLNENQQPIPNLSTIEQVRRAKPSTFLIRRDLRSLAAPPTLLIPTVNETRGKVDGQAVAPIPANVLATANSPETLQASTPEVLPAGTLMHYVTYLPRCSVKRGRRTKELGLLLATRRNPGSPMRRTRANTQDLDEMPSRAYYIGLEDSTPAIFPAKFALSPVAGPENISGVHSLASILRKFRLPLSVRPIYTTEEEPEGLVRNHSIRTSTASTGVLNCGLSAVQGLLFNEKNYMRLESIHRSDLLIISPVSTPDRLFLITPSMLKDHVFQLGTSSDPVYSKLVDNHRNLASNFLASAHSEESLNYLVRHMRDVTREPRQSYTNRQTRRSRVTNADFGKTIESQLSQEEIYNAYDELDDIYFHIRHGYYPSKNQRPGTPCKTNPTESGSTTTTPFPEARTVLSRRPTAESIHKSGMPTAEDLLVASLNTPVHQQKTSLQSRFTNGSAHRTHPREYEI